MAQPHNVFMIGWEYPPHNSGGLGVACQGLTEALAQAGDRIYFTLPYAHPHAPHHLQMLGCFDPRWNDVSPHQPPFSAYATPSAVTPAADLDAVELAALPQSQLEQRVNEYSHYVTQAAADLNPSIDGIHAHDWMSFPAAMQVKAKFHKPMIAHIHSTEQDRIPNGHGSAFITQTEKAGLLAADQVITVSHYTKRLLINWYGISPDKIVVVHNGIAPLATPQPKPTFALHRPVIVFMGRLTMQKGAEYFLQLAQQVTAQIPEALFVVAGDGDQYHSLLLKNAALQLSAHLLFTGFLRDRQRELLLNRADIFIMPSLSEPFGLVALEAAQRHTPVIVSKNSGVSEVLPSAKTVDFWDMDVMVAEVVKLLHDSQYYQHRVADQLQEVHQVTWTNAAQRLQQVYRKVFTGA